MYHLQRLINYILGGNLHKGAEYNLNQLAAVQNNAAAKPTSRSPTSYDCPASNSMITIELMLHCLAASSNHDRMLDLQLSPKPSSSQVQCSVQGVVERCVAVAICCFFVRSILSLLVDNRARVTRRSVGLGRT